MKPESPEEMKSFVDAIATQQLGAAPQQGQPAQPAPAQPTPSQVAAQQEAPKTPQENAVEKGSPETEGDMAAAKSFTIDLGDGQTRELTESQIAGMMNRYKDLNFQQMQSKPLLGMMAGAMKELGVQDPRQFTQFLSDAVAAAKQKNMQYGGNDDHPNKVGAPPGQGQDADWDKKMKEWAEKNAVDLPPGYSDMMKGQQQTQAQLGQMMQLIQQLAGRQSGQMQAAQQATQQVNQRAQFNTQQAIALNLNKVQQALGLPDDAAQDFMTFATERGFVPEDFIDPNLTMRLAQDFSNARNSGELDRLKQVIQKRQAYTGAGAQGAEGAAGAPGNGDDDLAKLTDYVKAKRF